MWRMVILVVVASACSKGGASPPVANAASAGAPRVPCPAEADVAARVRVLWSVPAEQAIQAACTPGRFPAPGWVVAAMVDVSDEESWERTVVLAAADGALVAQGEQNDVAPWYRDEVGGPTAYQTMDFDGDGVDELILESSASHGGSQVSALDIARLSGASFVPALHLETHYDNGGAAEDAPDVIECDVDTTFIGDGKVVFIRAVGSVKTERADPPEDCWAGTRTYRLVGDVFVDRE